MTSEGFDTEELTALLTKFPEHYKEEEGILEKSKKKVITWNEALENVKFRSPPRDSSVEVSPSPLLTYTVTSENVYTVPGQDIKWGVPFMIPSKFRRFLSYEVDTNGKPLGPSNPITQNFMNSLALIGRDDNDILKKICTDIYSPAYYNDLHHASDTLKNIILFFASGNNLGTADQRVLAVLMSGMKLDLTNMNALAAGRYKALVDTCKDPGMLSTELAGYDENYSNVIIYYSDRNKKLPPIHIYRDILERLPCCLSNFDMDRFKSLFGWARSYATMYYEFTKRTKVHSKVAAYCKTRWYMNSQLKGLVHLINIPIPWLSCNESPIANLLNKPHPQTVEYYGDSLKMAFKCANTKGFKKIGLPYPILPKDFMNTVWKIVLAKLKTKYPLIEVVHYISVKVNTVDYTLLGKVVGVLELLKSDDVLVVNVWNDVSVAGVFGEDSVSFTNNKVTVQTNAASMCWPMSNPYIHTFEYVKPLV
jgi:hypothetical protein